MDIEDREREGTADIYLSLTKYIQEFVNRNFPLSKDDMRALTKGEVTENITKRQNAHNVLTQAMNEALEKLAEMNHKIIENAEQGNYTQFTMGDVDTVIFNIQQYMLGRLWEESHKIKLDENYIMQVAENVRNGEEPKEALLEALGGERLDDIFDNYAKKGLIECILNDGKIHTFLSEGTGIDILEGLLNNRIIGDLSNFYMIKSSYILALNPNEQMNMARCISAGREDLCIVLQKLWSKGIVTEACTTKDTDNVQMLQLAIKADDKEALALVQQLYQLSDIGGRAIFSYEQNKFSVNLFGDNLYRYLQTDTIPKSLEQKLDIFKSSIEENLAFAQEMYDSYVKHGIDTTEVEKELRILKSLLTRFCEKSNSWELSPEAKSEVLEQMKKISKETNLSAGEVVSTKELSKD